MSQPISRLKRRLPGVLFALGLMALLAWALRPMPRLVDTEAVSRGSLVLSLEAEGRTRLVDRYWISAPLAGTLRRLGLEVGDAVSAGSVVAVLDALAPAALDKRGRRQAEARIAARELELAARREAVKASQAAADYASAELARLQRLFGRANSSETELDKARSEAERTKADLASARFRVGTAEQELRSALAELRFVGELDGDEAGVLELRAPVSGRVLKRERESARVVQAGDPILEIGDPTQLEVEADLLSADAVRLAPGMRAWLERWGEAEPLAAEVERIEPVAFTKISALGVEEQRVWVILGLRSPRARWERLGDGYRVSVRFLLWEGSDVLRVPTSALFRQGADWALFVAEGGRARLRRVRIGQRGGLESQVLAGVEEGEQVILHPDREIAEGVRIATPGER